MDDRPEIPAHGIGLKTVHWRGLLLLSLCFLSLFGSELTARSMESTADGWTTSCLDCPHGVSGFSHRAAALDSAGLAHIAYGGEQLYYASEQPAGGWEVEVVDSWSGAGSGASLALDSSDRPHLVYPAVTGTLVYATRSGSAWRVEVLARQGRQPIIAVDSTGRPHVSFYDPANADLIYGVGEPDGWRLTTVDSEGDVGQDNSLALDSQDRPHISYLGGQQVKYAFFDGESWPVMALNEPDPVSAGTAIAVDDQDRPHIAYHSSSYNPEVGSFDRLIYSYRDATDWKAEVVDERNELPNGFRAFVGFYPSLQLDGSGNAYISYAAEGEPWGPVRWISIGVIYLATRTASGWARSEVIAGRGSLRASSSLLLVPEEQQIFYVGSRGLQRTTVLPTGEKEVELIDNVGRVTMLYEMVVDSQGRMHTVYQRGEPWYARHTRSGVEREQLGGYWVHANLAAGPDSRLCLTREVRDWHASPLILSCRDGGQWRQISTFPMVNAAPETSDLAIGPDGRIHVVYYGSVDYQVWETQYQRQRGAGWEDAWDIFTLPVPRPANSALTVDGEGISHFAFGGNAGLIYATLRPSGWLTETVDARMELPLGAPAIATGLDNEPHLAYTLGGTLYHNYRTGGAWQREVVATDVDGPSLGVDVEGKVHLAYRSSAGEVIYAFQDGTGWRYRRIGHTNAAVSMALAPLGRPVIAFVTNSEWSDLVVAFVPFEPVIDVYLPLIER